MTSLPLAVVRTAYAEAAWILEQADVPSLAIKGPVSSALLQQPHRVSSDADLLVPPASFERAVSALAARGWVELRPGLTEQEATLHSVTLQRPPGAPVRTELDLHRTFPGFSVRPDQLWGSLVRDAETVDIAHRPVRAPSAAAALLFVVLHAARSGVDVGKPLSDLQRALDVVRLDVWRRAAALAVETGAVPAMRAGLALTADGRRLADDLCLGDVDLEWALRSQGASGVALFLVGWWRAPLRRKLPLLAREVWPTTAFMRIDWLGPDEGGTRALLRAHRRRWWSLLRRLPPATRALWRGRRNRRRPS